MKLLIIVAIAFALGLLIGRMRRPASNSNDLLRIRAENLASLIIMDGTRKVPEPKPGPNNLEITGASVKYAPLPRIVVTEWSRSGVVGGPVEAGSMQWGCPPGYTLKWDGGIPYCAVETR